MPKAVATDELFRRDLKTAPPDGFVQLRKLNYGEVLKRREMSQSMDMLEGEDGKPKGTIAMDMDGVAIFEFSRSIIEHNLQDKDDRPLNFSDPQDVLKLDPGVAQEIEVHITKLNSFDVDLSKDIPSSTTSEKPSGPKVVE